MTQSNQIKPLEFVTKGLDKHVFSAMSECTCLYCSNPPLCNGTLSLSFCLLSQIF